MAATHSVAWLRADTKLEALLFEESLIKAYRPAYNRRQNKFHSRSPRRSPPVSPAVAKA